MDDTSNEKGSLEGNEHTASAINFIESSLIGRSLRGLPRKSDSLRIDLVDPADHEAVTGPRPIEATSASQSAVQTEHQNYIDNKQEYQNIRLSQLLRPRNNNQ